MGRRIAAVLPFLLMWFLVTGLSGIVISALLVQLLKFIHLRPLGDSLLVLLAIALLSNILGILAGLHSARAALNPDQKKQR